MASIANILNELRRLVSRWWPWLLTMGLALVLVAGIARTQVDSQLRANGHEEAENWVRFVVQNVPELEVAVGGTGVHPLTADRLRLLAMSREMFFFQLFDLQGRLVVDSTDLAAQRRGLQPQAPSPDGLAAVQALADSGGAVRVDVVHNDRRRDGGANHHSVALVPLVGSDGRPAGVFKVHIDQSERAEALERSYLLLGALVLLLSVGLTGSAAWRALRSLREKLRTEERVRYLASHDVLSGTLNRTSFAEALQAAAWRRQGGGPGFAVLAIDLDHFKDVNDTHGHAAGDEVLRLVGERLRAVVRQGDAVARLGGDEFAVLQAGVAAPEDAARLAARIVELLGQPFDLGGLAAGCGASVGIALYEPGMKPEQLMKQADAALYQAKAQGRECHRFFDAGIEQAMQERRQLGQDLRGALEAGQLALAFQALHGTDGRRLRGYEALMRWTHPTRGPISPATFIPLAEENQLIGQLGEWALREACHQAAGWPDGLSVAVNLSPAQFERGDLVGTVRQALQDSGLAPQRLELEITESLLIQNTERVLAALDALGAMGVRIAMDDFGTGYSSLAYLWRFPFDKIKIDRAFVKDVADDPKAELIVKSIIELAHAMRIRVTGEGVENERQLAILRQHGCDEVQGFLLARPAPAEELQHRPQPAGGAAAGAGPAGSAGGAGTALPPSAGPAGAGLRPAAG